ncbi:hypothetical protein H5410_003050 [Solanum commersonii]|uniref:DUF4283 domain-containing protein n=1 Tax=Solanum commersonii TaxID=4109 RepID=A0A9J6B3L2_SOLCO|nr:hypothetical protein H5410_003050 [Solanum commersonii]
MEGTLNPIIIIRSSLKFLVTLIDTPFPIKKVSKIILPTNPKAPTTSMRIRKPNRTRSWSLPDTLTTKQGQHAVIYDMDDFMNKLTMACKYTLIGKFSTTMPTIELIRKSFILQTQLNRGVNFAYYNARHVFIDFDNELDYNTVWTQQKMTIEGKLIRIEAWTPNFRPEEETPILFLYRYCCQDNHGIASRNNSSHL